MSERGEGNPLPATRSLKDPVSHRGEGVPPPMCDGMLQLWGVNLLPEISVSNKNIEKSRRLSTHDAHKSTILGMNGVHMARHGLISNDNEATGSGKVFKYPPGLQDIIFISKIAAKVQKYEKRCILQ